MKMSTHLFQFSRECSDRLYPQVAFRMLLGARKPSRSVTAASLLIKYDYSVIELGNMIFRKAVEFFWYIAWKDLIKETNLNGRQCKCNGLLINAHILRTEIAKLRPQISIKQHVRCSYKRRLLSLKTNWENQYLLTKMIVSTRHVVMLHVNYNSRERNVIFRTSVKMVSFNAFSSSNDNQCTSVTYKLRKKIWFTSGQPVEYRRGATITPFT